MGSIQQVLNLPSKVTYEAADFFVSPTNQLGFQWIESWPAWPHHCLVLYGPKGCGKTHLAHIWKGRSQAEIIPYEELKTRNLDDLCQSQKALIVEDIPAVFDDALLFHFLNAVQQADGFLLLTADVTPQSWLIDLPDLRSRIQASMWAQIQSADDDLLKAMIHKVLADEQIIISDQVISYLLSHLDRSFEVLSHAVRQINRYAFATKRKITLPLVKEVLAQQDSMPV